MTRAAMTCIDDLEVLDYVERRVGEARRSQIREHLDTCRDCLMLVDELAHARSPVAIDGLTLGRTISSGGMGLIVEAYDTKLERRIAVKLPRTADPIVHRRFEREVKITARLQHPAIVPVYAAGALDDGDPYYAMRLVDGESLDVAIARATTTAARLGLVRVVTAVAGAIAYAHGQRVIHRDIKPANVLVGRFGEVVVIDWGLARTLDESEPDAAIATGSPGPPSIARPGFAGARSTPAGSAEVIASPGATATGAVLGTPAYMAPEQARGEPLDERADVYALGAMLYHVLAGAPPGAGAPADLTKLGDLPVDLLAIVNEAMAVDREGRYRTAAELVADLERFATGRLVGAHAYSLGQLARRWLREHKTAAIASLLVLAVAVTGVIAWSRIGDAERSVAVQREASDDLVDYMLVDLQSKLAKIGKLDVLVGIGAKLDTYYTALGATPAAIDRGRWARALDILGDVANERGDLVQAKAYYERALGQRRELAATTSHATVLEHLGTSHVKLGKVQLATGDAAAALASFEAGRDAFTRLAATRPDDLDIRRQQVDAIMQLGYLHFHRTDSKAARTAFEAGLAIADPLVIARPKEPAALRLQLAALSGLAATVEYDGELERAHELANKGVAIAEAIAAVDDQPANRQNLATLSQRLGAVAEKRGDGAGALAAFRRSAMIYDALVSHDPANATWQSALGLALMRVGDAERVLAHRAESTAAYERALELFRTLVERDPNNVVWMRELAHAYSTAASWDFDLGALARAEQRYRAGLALVENMVAADPNNQQYQDDLYVHLGQMGEIVHARGDRDAALGFFERRLATARGMLEVDPGNPHQFRVSNAYEDMSRILMDRGDAAGARDAAQRSLEIREQLVAASPDHVRWRGALASSYESLAQAQDAPKDARPLIEKAIEHRRALAAADGSDVVLRVELLQSLMIHGRVTRDLGDLDAAARAQADALAIVEPLHTKDPTSALFALYYEQTLEIGGDVAAARRQRDAAARHYRTAIAALEPFRDPALGDPQIAGEIAEAKWKLSQVVGRPERAALVRDAIAILEQLRRERRLAPDRAQILARIRRGAR